MCRDLRGLEPRTPSFPVMCTSHIPGDVHFAPAKTTLDRRFAGILSRGKPTRGLEPRTPSLRGTAGVGKRVARRAVRGSVVLRAALTAGHCLGLLRTAIVEAMHAESTRGLRGTRTTQPATPMSSRSVPGSPDPRIRCTRGWRGQSCKKRRCSICGVRWARDWRRVLFEALKAPGVPVVLSAVTPPGATDLPWDERRCDHLGPHKRSSRLGCRVDGDALAAW